jgi:hypothetical protein
MSLCCLALPLHPRQHPLGFLNRGWPISSEMVADLVR